MSIRHRTCPLYTTAIQVRILLTSQIIIGLQSDTRLASLFELVLIATPQV